ncbi:Microtubule-actin cross-linking factor 1 [Rhizoctonia solani]|uniref:Microtubule-actin cross-linking factor 1 n=1 Tax=Rhizoctonia solani TaxID=456999 RepID=A0A0K6FR08_9AGAM|nr:Microtubule-actin cross-linking factor 1 [Rhizoctonia solani]
MLRWGRWAVVRVLGSRSAVVSESKNAAKMVWDRRLSLLNSSRETPAANEDTDITIRPNPIDPLETLRQLLLTDNRSDALESAYEACRAHHRLVYLTKSEFSQLSTRARPELIVRVCADQTALGRSIPDSDRYRYMLAHLECHSPTPSSKSPASGGVLDPREADPGPIEHLTHAQVHYTKLAKNRSGQAVHRAYLEHLLRIYRLDSDPQIARWVRDAVSNVLKSLLSRPRFRFEHALAQVVWSIVGSVRFDVPQTKSLLHLLRLRSSSSSLGSSVRVLDPIESLRQTILDPPSSDTQVNQEARSIIHDAQAWEWLRVLAGDPSLVTGAHTRLNVLASLRQLEHAPPGSDPPVALLERDWAVWMTILGAEATSVHQTPIIDRAILVAFLRLAARFQSVRVVSGSERLLTVFTSVICEEDQIHMAQPGSLSVQLGAVYACVGTSTVFELAARLSSAGFRSDRLQAGYLTHVIELLLEYRFPRVAWEVASQVRADLPTALAALVAHDCAKTGYITGAVSMLRDIQPSEERHRIAIMCLRQLDRQRGVLTRVSALSICEALGPDLSRTPGELQPVAVRMALNAGLVRLAGLMGTQWRLRPGLQRLLAARLVKARLVRFAPKVVDPRQTRWLSAMLDNAGHRQKIPASARRSHLHAYGKINATRLGNKLLIRSGARLGGRARLRATLATLARLLRARKSSWIRKRAPFRPDGVTLNIIVRALVRSPSCVSSGDLRAMFDLLSRAGRCGVDVTGNHFGTEAGFVLGGYASSAVALAGLVPRSVGAWTFVRYVRPLLRTFISGMRVRGDQEGVKVVTKVLRAEGARWTRAGWHAGPDA